MPLGGRGSRLVPRPPPAFVPWRRGSSLRCPRHCPWLQGMCSTPLGQLRMQCTARTPEMTGTRPCARLGWASSTAQTAPPIGVGTGEKNLGPRKGNLGSPDSRACNSSSSARTFYIFFGFFWTFPMLQGRREEKICFNQAPAGRLAGSHKERPARSGQQAGGTSSGPVSERVGAGPFVLVLRRRVQKGPAPPLQTAHRAPRPPRFRPSICHVSLHAGFPFLSLFSQSPCFCSSLLERGPDPQGKATPCFV